jgi:hypothetical protein
VQDPLHRSIGLFVFSATWERIRALHHADKHNDQGSLLPSNDTQFHQTFTVPRKPLLHTKPHETPDDNPTKGLPEYRLPLVPPFSLLIPTGLFIYGWSAKNQVHWIVPNLGTCIFAIGLIVCFNCARAYVVDTYTTYAASATGAAAFVRTIAGFSFPLFAPSMYDVLGVGWGNSLLGFVGSGLGMVAPVGGDALEVGWVFEGEEYLLYGLMGWRWRCERKWQSS